MPHWLAIGPPSNWRIGARKGVWAVSPNQYKSWGQVSKGDVVYFYATAPVKGLIGYATVSTTAATEKPFWPEEREKGHVLWPYHILLVDVRVLPTETWESKRLSPEREGIVFQRAFQPISDERASEWKLSLDRILGG